MTNGGIVIDVLDLDAIDIDPAARRPWAGAGVTAGAYTVAAVEHGLATGFGDTASVGIAGITLGGGIGYLSRVSPCLHLIRLRRSQLLPGRGVGPGHCHRRRPARPVARAPR
jgi:hypothetical protein